MSKINMDLCIDGTPLQGADVFIEVKIGTTFNGRDEIKYGLTETIKKEIIESDGFSRSFYTMMNIMRKKLTDYLASESAKTRKG